MSIPKKIITDLEVRFRDIDSMGHVNNAVFLTYFEEGRKVFLEKVMDIIDPADYPFILANISCDYLKPVKLGDQLSLKIWIGEIGDKSFTFNYHVIDRNNASIVFSKGKSVMVFFDYIENKTMRIPGKIFKKLVAYTEPDKK